MQRHYFVHISEAIDVLLDALAEVIDQAAHDAILETEEQEREELIEAVAEARAGSL